MSSRISVAIASSRATYSASVSSPPAAVCAARASSAASIAAAKSAAASTPSMIAWIFTVVSAPPSAAPAIAVL